MHPRSKVTRRNFLAASGAGATAFYMPRQVSGHDDAEMRVMAADGKLIGVSKWDLDTPALCVDLDTLERNIATMRTKLAGTGVAIRPHGKTHKCPAIARLQLASGSIGICAAKLSEAEVFSANGVEPILMTTSNVSAGKIRRAMQLRKKKPALHSGRGLSTERPRPERCRERSRRRRRRGD